MRKNEKKNVRTGKAGSNEVGVKSSVVGILNEMWTRIRSLGSGLCKAVSRLFQSAVCGVASSRPVTAFVSWVLKRKMIVNAWKKVSVLFKSLHIAKVIRAGALLVGLFLVFMPVLPQLPYYFRQLMGENTYQKQESGLYSGYDSGGQEGGREQEAPEVNTLIIPAVGIDVPIVEGSTDEALNRGAWRRPSSSTPAKGGNTVITGHRFRYLPPSNLTFYHLDKVELDDDVIVYWDEKRYEYTVSDVFVVESNQVEIESNTTDPRLTLYTCTPLWTAKQRLVIIAIPVADADGREGGSVELEEL